MKPGGQRPEGRAASFKCYLDGKEIKDKALLRALNEEEISVFESLRIYNGKIFRLEEHLRRLTESSKSCGVELPPASGLRPALQKAIAAHRTRNGFIRITVHDKKVHAMIGERNHPSEIYKAGVDLKTSSFRMPSPKETNVQSKTGNYRLQLLTTVSEPRALPAGQAGTNHESRGGQGPPYDWLFLDENHFLTESRVGNFCIVKKGALLTPPARSVLRGITLNVVLECARELGLQTSEIPLTRHDAFNADEAFLTNTSWELLPVRSLDGRVIPAGIPGPITRKLTHCFQRKVQSECRLESNARSSRSRTKKG